MDISTYKGKIIDTHAHVYPDKIALKAVQSISDFYSIPMVGGNGSLSELIQNGERHGVGRFVIHSLATTPRQVRSINNFILTCAASDERLIPFATLHPDMSRDEMDEELERVIPLGMKGLKLHPDFQRFKADSDVAMVMYEAVDARLPILFHAGDSRYDYSGPRRMANVARAFPDQQIIAAHLGGFSEWDKVGEYEGLRNVWYDTCSALPFLETERAYEIMRTLGMDRIMFATDYPMWNYTEELMRFAKLPLTEEERENILYKNAERLIGL